MNPELRAILEDIQTRLTALERVENVPFIENVKRRARLGTVTVEGGASTVGTTADVRNAADNGTETVAETYAGAITITDAQGNTYRVGYYS